MKEKYLQKLSHKEPSFISIHRKGHLFISIFYILNDFSKKKSMMSIDFRHSLQL